MKSMTGFGIGEFTGDGLHCRVEISSVNRKQKDVLATLPRELAALDRNVRSKVAEKVSRGRVTVKIQLEPDVEAPSQNLEVDQTLAARYLEELSTIAKENGRDPSEIDLTQLLRAPGVFSVVDCEIEPTEAWPLIEKTIDQAWIGFENMRLAEGANLAADIATRVESIRTSLEEIATLSPGVINHYRDSLHRRLNEAGLEIDLNDERVLKEIGIFAERCDISEEITRLKSHFVQFDTYSQSSDPVGRPLDFMSQEMNREFNTIGSKANSANITAHVVSAKTEIEKIREQVQNLE